MLHTLLIIIHILVSIVLVAVVLLQSSKGGGLAGAFGGGGGSPQQMLGSKGMTTLLHKMTVYLAVAFFMTSFLLFMTQDLGSSGVGGNSGSVMQEAAESGEVIVPVTTPVDDGSVPEGSNTTDGTTEEN